MRVILTHNPINEEELLDELEAPEVGAQVVFKGIVRNHHEGKKVLHLFYEAYEEMAKSQMESLAQKIKDQHDIYDIVIAHRLGKLAIGQVSLLAIVTSAHRAESFKACQQAIDDFKRDIPIWKKEVFEGGEEWLENKEAKSVSS